MKRFLMLAAIGGVLTMTAPRASAGLNYSASKSNTGNFSIAYHNQLVSADQAAAVLNDLDKMGRRALDETALRGILKSHGVPADRIRKIVIEPGKSGRSGGTILLLANPQDEAQARDSIGGLDKSPQ